MVRKVHQWYKTSTVRKVYGTKSMVPQKPRPVTFSVKNRLVLAGFVWIWSVSWKRVTSSYALCSEVKLITMCSNKKYNFRLLCWEGAILVV